MITLAQAKIIAEAAGIALPILIEAFKAAQCAIADCDVELQPADAPDLLRRAQENRARLAAKAAGVDRATIDARLRRPTQSAFGDARGIDDGDTEHPDAAEVYGPGDYDG